MIKSSDVRSPDTSRIFRALTTSDDIGALLRTHFDAERALSQVIAEAYVNSDALRLRSFEQKISALEARGVLPLRLAPTRIVNDVRNDFAHRGRENFEPSDVKKLWDAVNKFALNTITPDFNITYGPNGTSETQILGSMADREKFVILASIATMWIASLPTEWSQHTGGPEAPDFLHTKFFPAQRR